MSDEHVQATIEHFDNAFDRLVEALRITITNPAKDSALQESKTDAKTIKQAATTTNKELRKLRKRADRLETAVQI